MIAPLYGRDSTASVDPPGGPQADPAGGAGNGDGSPDPGGDGGGGTVGTTDTPSPPPTGVKPDERAKKVIAQAAHDTRVLVSYLARRDSKKLKAIAIDYTVADRLTAGEYSSDLEAKLWEQLGLLSEAAHPASAESISDSRYYVTIVGSENEQQSRAGRKLRNVRVWACVALAVTFLLGVYVSITSSAVALARADLAERTKIIQGDYEGTRAALFVQPSGNGQPKLDGPPDEQQQPDEMEQQPVNDQPASAGAEQGSATDAQQEPAANDQSLAPESVAAETTTETTGQPAAEGPPDADLPEESEQPESPQDRQAALINMAHDELEGEINLSYSLVLPAMLGSDRLSGEYAKNGEKYDLFNVVLLDLQESLNRIIENYLIPMLGAFLGVAVYIIRDTNERLESVSLSPMDADGYWPRILLGLVAGLTIGWIAPTNTAATAGAISADALGVLQNLSKTAIAFVVGYSIEVLFNILDAIKTALGVRDERQVKKDGS